jgi:hypothetical protein
MLIARLRTLFRFPEGLRKTVPDLFAYIEWYTEPLHSSRTSHVDLLSVARTSAGGVRRGKPKVAIIPVSRIMRSCHLLPMFPTKTCPRSWHAANVLDLAGPRFFVSSYLDLHTFQLLRLPLLLKNLDSTCTTEPE